MAAYKPNKLHLHLADDEGWRIEIPALPELAAIGSKRCHEPSERTCLLPQLGAGPAGTGDRKSVVEGQSVSVRVHLGGRRIIKNKQYNITSHRGHYTGPK